MKRLTKADAGWLKKLLVIVEFIYQEYPELFSEEDEDDLKVARELIRSLDNE